MDGTTRCPHCETRFRIGHAQLEAHQGMVRCGKCMQIFDARLEFISDQPSPQLELEMSELAVHVAQSVELTNQPDTTELNSAVTQVLLTTETDAVVKEGQEAQQDELPHEDALNFIAPRSLVRVDEIEISNAAQINSDTADQSSYEAASVADAGVEQEPRSWLWAVPATALSVLLTAQLAYFYRADIAARQPGLNETLQRYCELLNCTVGLPQSNELMSIESSTLEADPNVSRHITLSALLRNRASYPLAYPNLELTLNDGQDHPVARRTFKPVEYLPEAESMASGLLANHETSIKLYLDTTDLSPNGYRLALYYPAK